MSNDLFEENVDFVEREHINAFAKALVWEEGGDYDDTKPFDLESSDLKGSDLKGAENEELGSKSDINTVALTPMKRAELITSKSDWYPVHTPMKNPFKLSDDKRKSRSKKRKAAKSKLETVTNEFRKSASYTLLRWPILVFIVMWMVFLCSIYVTIRAFVALLEYYLTWVGQRKRLRDKLRTSTTYPEWIENALALDHYLNLDKWSLNPRFSYYDYRTIRLTIARLESLLHLGSDYELMNFLQGCIKKNFAGIENRQLYSHRYYGTKNQVEKYIDITTVCINKVIDSESIPFADKRRFFRIVLKNYGKTALCLSGGACFAYTHFGVIKALLDNGLLPSIISGTSCGGLVAALACTRTDEELKKLLVPQLARKITACEDPWYVWVPRFWKTGARFDSVLWAEKSCFFTRGSLTFQEAFKRTGRKLNISTVPSDPHSPVILCNNITSPNCIIWSSLLASAAVPGILNPVVLMMKNKNDEVTPFSLGNKWKDGSLRTDIPVEALNTYYNVNFSIVSQVNPHILLFFYAPKGTVGRPVAIPRRYTNKQQYESFRGGFILSAIEQLLKLEITKWLRMIKSLDLLPHLFQQDWLNIWLQRFSGSITIWPRNRLKDFWYILSDPSEERLEEMLMTGQRSMFPRLLFIKHRLTIERAIERGRKLTKLANKVDSAIDSDIGLQSGVDFHTVSYEDDEDNVSDSSESWNEDTYEQFNSEDDDKFKYSSESRTATPEFQSPELNNDSRFNSPEIYSSGTFSGDDQDKTRRFTIH